MQPTAFIAYYRVSTQQQGKSGLGLDAQQAGVAAYIGPDRKLLQAFTEIESGTRSDRPQLDAALKACRLTGATLIVGKLDRLARNTRFLLSVVEGCGEGGVVCCDMPQIPPGPVGRFLLTQMAAVAELEAGLISARTKAALAAVKARGRTLGGWRGGPKVDPAAGRAARTQAANDFAARIKPVILPLCERGLSLRQIGAALAARGIQTAAGGGWSADAVRRVLARLDVKAPNALPDTTKPTPENHHAY